MLQRNNISLSGRITSRHISYTVGPRANLNILLDFLPQNPIEYPLEPNASIWHASTTLIVVEIDHMDHRLNEYYSRRTSQPEKKPDLWSSLLQAAAIECIQHIAVRRRTRAGTVSWWSKHVSHTETASRGRWWLDGWRSWALRRRRCCLRNWWLQSLVRGSRWRRSSGSRDIVGVRGSAIRRRRVILRSRRRRRGLRRILSA